MMSSLEVGIQTKKKLYQIKKRLFRSLARIYQYISPSYREFKRIWPEIDTIEGYLVSPIQEHWLFKAAKSLPEGATIVEIGSFKGRSTCCLAFGCVGTKKHVYAIDTFDGNDIDFLYTDFFGEFLGNVKNRGLSDYVTPIQGKSTDMAKKWNRPIHLLFIDGSHQYDDVIADFNVFFPSVVPGGIVAIHDVVVTWPGPLRAWNDYIKYHLDKIGMCKSLAFGRKKLSL